MGPRTERRPRGWSLTRRLIVALSIGALFVAVVLGFLGADRDNQHQSAARAEAEQHAAIAMAERAADLFLLHEQQTLANSPKVIYSYSLMTHGLQQACNGFFVTLPQKKFIHEADRAEWQETRSQLFRRMLEISCAKLNACRDEALKAPAGGSPNEWGGPR